MKPIKQFCAIAIEQLAKFKMEKNRKKVKRYFLIAEAIIVLVIIIGGYFWLINPLEMRAYKNALKEIQNFQSTEFSISNTMLLDIKSLPDSQTPGNELSLNIKIIGLGKIDLPNKKMKATISTAIFNQEVSVQEILIGDQVYLQSKVDDPYYKLSAGSIANMTTQLFSFINFKENQNWGDLSKDSTAQYIGKDKVDGQHALRYEISLTKEDINKSIQKILDNLSANLGDQINLSLQDIQSSDVKITVWVDKKTFTPLQEEIKISQISFTLPAKGTYTLKDIVTKVSYRQFNKPVQIEAPTNFRELPIK